MAGILSIQFNPDLGDKEANLNKVREIISQYCDKQLDLVVIPEFFSTGIHDKSFIEAPEDVEGGIVTKFLSKTAKRFNTNIVCGSVIEKEGSNLYNTAFVLDRHGEIVGKYRKIHLFNYFGGNEGTYTTAGEHPLVVELDFARVGVSLCFDIKFPMLYRKLIQRGAEIVVSPSAWSNMTSLTKKEKEDFVTTWRAMNICRAAENLVYFVTSNLTGKFLPNFYSIGNSMITSPMGEVLENAQEIEGGIYAICDLQKVRELKGAVPVYQME